MAFGTKEAYISRNGKICLFIVKYNFLFSDFPERKSFFAFASDLRQKIRKKK